MKKEKVFRIQSNHNNRSTVFEGTMNHLLTNVFGYNLECGYSWNKKINRYPKTGVALVRALNESATECRNYHDSYRLLD